LNLGLTPPPVAAETVPMRAEVPAPTLPVTPPPFDAAAGPDSSIFAGPYPGGGG
jgi:hypothetical protein